MSALDHMVAVSAPEHVSDRTATVPSSAPLVPSSAPLLLFDRPQSNNCARLRMWIYLKRLEMAFEIRSTSQAEQRTKEFSALNPNSKIPLLLVRDGGDAPQPITESAVIAEYLEERFEDRCFCRPCSTVHILPLPT